MPTEIHKHDGQTWQAITEIQYTDDTLTDRDITEVHYNDAGTWRQVFGSAVAAETLAWDASAPTGSYNSTSPFGIGDVTFTADVSGGFLFIFTTSEAGSSTGTPTSGMYRPGLTGVDAVNYEISITAGSVIGSGVRVAIGSGTLIDGTWQPLDGNRGVQMSVSGTGTGSISVSVQIREIANPGTNLTAVASFTLLATVL